MPAAGDARRSARDSVVMVGETVGHGGHPTFLHVCRQGTKYRRALESGGVSYRRRSSDQAMRTTRRCARSRGKRGDIDAGGNDD